MESARPSRSGANENTSNSLELQKRYHKEAYDAISLGLDLDSQNPKEAVSFYSKGISVLRKAVRLEFSPEEWSLAKATHDKMKKNLEDVEYRYQEILRQIEGGTPSLGGTLPISSKPDNSNFVDLTEEKTFQAPSSKAQSSSSRSSKSSSKPSTKSSSSIPSTPSKTTGHVRKDSLTKSNEAPVSNNKERAKQIKGVDPKIAEMILDDLVDSSPGVSWSDIAGLGRAKQAIQEMIINPMLRPDLFTGLRSPMKGVLFFGPPGNGKTYLAKACATEANATFFAVNPSSLTSKWHGESEKFMKALFGVARYLQPSMIFIDEIDSILSERSSSEHEASRRLKTEFLVQFDGMASTSDDRVFVMGATNRPQDIDEAALRRFSKKIYIPLPNEEGRQTIIKSLLSKETNVKIRQNEFQEIIKLTKGYSASDLKSLCREAAFQPTRRVDIRNISASDVPPITFEDFKLSLASIRPSAKAENLKALEEWNQQYGGQ